MNRGKLTILDMKYPWCGLYYSYYTCVCVIIVTNKVEVCLDLLRSVNSSSLVGFDSAKSELGRMYVEAKDNVRFLMTLERHFKNITAG